MEFSRQYRRVAQKYGCMLLDAGATGNNYHARRG
jgi:hypothetical protein